MILMVMAVVAALAQTPAEGPQKLPSDAQFRAARNALDAKLLDYPSARFRDVHADHFRICGMVNARNSLGAYTGWKQFGVLGSGQTGSIAYFDDRPADLADLCANHTDQDFSERMLMPSRPGS